MVLRLIRPHSGSSFSLDQEREREGGRDGAESIDIRVVCVSNVSKTIRCVVVW